MDTIIALKDLQKAYGAQVVLLGLNWRKFNPISQKI